MSQEKQAAAMEMSAEDTQIPHVTGNRTARRVLQKQLLPLPWKRSTASGEQSDTVRRSLCPSRPRAAHTPTPKHVPPHADSQNTTNLNLKCHCHDDKGHYYGPTGLKRKQTPLVFLLFSYWENPTINRRQSWCFPLL